MKGLGFTLFTLFPHKVARWPVFHQPSRHFSASLAVASIFKICACSWYFENK